MENINISEFVLLPNLNSEFEFLLQIYTVLLEQVSDTDTVLSGNVVNLSCQWKVLLTSDVLWI